MTLGIGHRRQNLVNNKPFWDSILQNSRIILNNTHKWFQKSDPVLFLLLTSGSGFPVLWSDNLCIAEGWRNCIGGGSGNCSHAWRKRKRQRWGESCIGEQIPGCLHREFKQEWTLISISLYWTSHDHETFRDVFLWLESDLNFKAVSREKHHCLESLRKCQPLEVATGARCPHSRSNHPQCTEICDPSEFLGATSLEWLL